MKPYSPSEKLFIEEIMNAAQQLKRTTRGLSIGSLIKSIRIQLGMSQKALALRAGVPQSTVSRIEKGQSDLAMSSLNKLLSALSCDLIIAPLLHDSIDNIRQRQAKKLAEKQVKYLTGTMNLEEQQPDHRFIEEMLKQEEERLLHGPKAKLWKDS
jgi:transcriptional regulator with XRE-family HTH domain